MSLASVLWAGFLVLVILVLGRPGDGITWVALVGAAPLLLLGALPNRKAIRVPFWVVSSLYCVYFFAPLESDKLLDLHGGRTSITVYPGLCFHKRGVNTDLIEEYLGPRPPAWHFMHTRCADFWLGRWYDGADVVVGKSLIRRPYLPKVLGVLPDRQARRKVLGCITDPENILRAYQEHLLLRAWVLGFPRGLDESSWWQRHEWIFEPCDDPDRAARLVHGLLEKFGPIVLEDASPQGEEARWALKDHYFSVYALTEGHVLCSDSRLCVAIRQRMMDGGEDAPPPEAWVNKITWWEGTRPTAQGASQPPGTRPSSRGRDQ